MSAYNLTREQSVDLLVRTALEYGITDRRQLAYIVGTAQHETDNFNTSREYDGPRQAIRNGYRGGENYYGRGYVQVTHEDNYDRMATVLGDPRIRNTPDIVAQDAGIGARATVVGMARGLYTGVGLDRYINSSGADYVGARAIVNGTDRADLIAGYARQWEGRMDAIVDRVSAQGITPRAMPGSPMADGALSPRERGPEVARLQEALRRNGADIVSDGLYGDGTRRAVESYQRQAGLPASGTADAATLARLGVSAVPPAPMADGVLREGERGPEVTRLQQRLNALGFRDAEGRALGVDGQFGTRTEQALIAFQRARGLEPDGLAGPRTLAALEQPNPARPNPGAPAPSEPAPGVGLRSGWPVPGRTVVNLADRPGEGGGEFGEPRSGGREHKGIDINGRVGDRIEAFAPGQVVFTGPMRGFGNTVIIQHEGGLQTVYAHLDRITVRDDQRVDRTTQIGSMGRSGNTPSAGDTHLHFEIREGANGQPLTGRAVDPRRYLNFEGETSRRVGEIQQQLQRLDVRDARGQPIVADMSYGARTREAVESFQRSRGIEVTGIVDPSTFDALRRAQPRPAEAAPRAAGEPAADARAVALASPLVREASAALARDQPGLGAEQRLHAAVALADAASRRGLTGIDSVAAGPNGSLFAIQGDPRRDDAQQAVATRERLAQPIELGVAQLAEQERQRAASLRAELPAEHREVRSPHLA
jgi:peptidoglycan hydrolase-like protein with peptidoglycan-binding domain